VNLLELSPPAPPSAGIADGATPGDTLGGYVVRAVAMPGEPLALAPITLWSHGATISQMASRIPELEAANDAALDERESAVSDSEDAGKGDVPPEPGEDRIRQSW